MIKITAIPYQANCEELFNVLRDLPFACWLDSGKPRSEYGRYDIISALPAVRLITAKNQTTIYDCKLPSYDYIERARHRSNPLTRIKIELDKLTITRTSLSDNITIEDTAELSNDTKEQDNIPFSGGAIGYFGYDLHKDLQKSQLKDSIFNRHHESNKEDNKQEKTDRQDDNESQSATSFDDMQVGIYHWAIIQDHQLKQAYITSLPECDPLTLQIITSKLHGLANHSAISKNTSTIEVGPLEPTLSKKLYTDALSVIGEYIVAGDAYQVNFAQRFQGSYKGDPFLAYRQLRKAMASPFCAYLQLGDQAIMSLSPERFLQVTGNKVLAQPIKGTVRRDNNSDIDKQQATALQQDEKNRAENLMIVDLLRNDIGQHCIPGSISVKTLFGLQSFPNVHHLVSDIVGTLKITSSSLDLFNDCFPGGSITGAPKKRAMEIIDELESGARGVYCGSIGYINNNGDMDTNIAIRTVSCDGEQLTCWGGGGIVADSNADDEYQESLDKINRILTTLSPQS